MTKNKIMAAIAAVSCAAACTAFADAEHVNYVTKSNAQAAELAREANRYESAGWFPLAVSILPQLELPFDDWRVTGLRLNLFAGEHLDVYGVDVGTLANCVTREFGGVQVSCIYNSIGESCGAFQLAGVVNRCDGPMHGLQLALVNCAESGDGLQIGALNYGNEFRGVQLGLVNIIEASRIPVLPVLNFAF